MNATRSARQGVVLAFAGGLFVVPAVPAAELGCFPSSPPEPEMIGDQVSAKNRFLSIKPGDLERWQAIRVTFLDLPPPHDMLNGLVMWVGEPMQLCDKSNRGLWECVDGACWGGPLHGSDCTTQPDCFDQVHCGPTPGLLQPWTWFARLQCTPFYTNWTQLTAFCRADGEPCTTDDDCSSGPCEADGVVHIFNEGIVPGGTYAIQVIDDTCSVPVESGYSTPLLASTSQWGDVVGTFANGDWFAPDGIVNFFDVVGEYNKWLNLPDGRPTKARADIAPSVVDAVVDLGDIGGVISAYDGDAYPFSPPSPPDGCTLAAIECGNSIIEPGEGCDDGNSIPGDGCSENCQPELCGNGAVDGGEECDDSNTIAGDGCDDQCRLESTCGNGVTESGEECDDGNRTAGDGCNDRCRVEGTATVSLVPVGNHSDGSLDSGVTIQGNEIILPTGGRRVFLEVRISGWDPRQTGVLVHVYQVALDAAGYTSGMPGTLIPTLIYCDNDEECFAAFGAFCVRSSLPCSGDSDCPGEYDSCQGPRCVSPSIGPSYCEPGFIHEGRSDYMFFDDITLVIQSVHLSASGYRYGSFPLPYGVGEDPGSSAYAGTLVLDVSEDAAGTFTIRLRRGASETFMTDWERNPIGIAAFEPALITLPAPCCLPDGTCNPEMFEQDCTGTGGAAVPACAETDENGNGVNDACEQVPCCNAGTCEVLAPADPLDCTSQGGTVVPVCFGDPDGSGIDDACGCLVSSAPQPDMLTIPGRGGGAFVNFKNRYLSIEPGEPGRNQAIRVTAVDLPSPFDVWNGQQWYVGKPVQVCENSGQGPDVPVADCGPAPGLPAKWFWAAPLLCELENAHFTDWSTRGVVDIYHEGIVPEGVYHIQVVDGQCDISSEDDYSAPLMMTQATWGDVVQDCTGCPCDLPDGSVDVITDVVSLLDRFQNRECAPEKSRADLEPGRPDFKLNISDVTRCLGAFLGDDYPFGAGNCYCVDPTCALKQCSGGPDHGNLCTDDSGCSSDPCTLGMSRQAPER